MHELALVLAQYPSVVQTPQVEFLGNAGGFSGSQFWRLQTPSGPLCLRRWPREHPSLERLREIHTVLRCVWQAGFYRVPCPLPTRSGETFAEHDGRLWELTPWLPGKADFHAQPTDARLLAALRTLARFHAAAETSIAKKRAARPSPGIGERLARLDIFLAGDLLALRRHVDEHRSRWPELAQRAQPLIELFSKVAPGVRRRLANFSATAVSLQPCIRDIWHDHVLFQGDDVTGLIDFGAMRIDHVATDIARLLGSLVGDDDARWQLGLAAYAEVRPLSPPERELVQAFDVSGVAMSGLSWIEWVFRDGRQFDAPAAVLARVDDHLRRLHCLAVH